MKVSIIGSGALGKTYGGLLALAGHEVHFLMHSEYAAIQKAEFFNITFNELKQTVSVLKPLLVTQSQDLPPSDLVILALKTTENDKIADLLSSCLKENTIVLIIQNGIGNEEFISNIIGQRYPLICGVATIGAIRNNPVDTEITFLGNIKLSAFKNKDQHYCEMIAKAFEKSPVHIPITLHENYRDIRWHKLAWNISFGAMSLIFDKSIDILATEQPYATLLLRIMQEVQHIALLDNVMINDNFLHQMITNSQKSKYFPTIYRDYKEGKPIEKTYLFDNVIAIAQKYQEYPPLLTLIEKQLTMMLVFRKNLC